MFTLNPEGTKRLAFAIIENCCTSFPSIDYRTKASNELLLKSYTIKCLFLEQSPLIQMVADVMGYDEKKFRDGLRARLEKEFYRTYRGKLNIKQII